MKLLRFFRHVSYKTFVVFLTLSGIAGLFASTAARAEDAPPDQAQLLKGAQDAAKGVSNPGIFVDGVKQASLADAQKALRPGSTLELRGVVLNEGIVIRDPGVKLIAVGSTLYGAAVQGKAAVVASGDSMVIDGLNCFGISVRDGNGACVRDQSNNLTLRHVHFHDSQEGILANNNTGPLTIEDSIIERNGAHGQAHNIYYSGREALTIRRSQVLSSTGQGHEVKSRAAKTTIEDSIIAGFDGNESRTIDVPNGGVLIVRNSILEKGRHAANRNVIGYGLETNKPQHPVSEIRLENVIVIADPEKPSLFLDLPKGSQLVPSIKNVKAIGLFRRPLPGGLTIFETRATAGLKSYPALPNLPKAR